MYRFVNNPRYNWRSLLYGVVKSFQRIVAKEKVPTDKEERQLRLFVVDDTTLEKFGTAMENSSQFIISASGHHSGAFPCAKVGISLCNLVANSIAGTEKSCKRHVLLAGFNGL